MTEDKKRIGLMGGTFDPIHNGHLMIAEGAYEQFSLDQIWFLPSGNPPHKAEQERGASDAQRLEMVRLAIRNNPHFCLDPEEMYRDGYTYTADTLQILKHKFPNYIFYFIIGADSLMSFDTWKDPAVICKNCRLTAAVRDQLPQAVMEEQINKLRRDYDAQIYLMQTPNFDVSSSSIRSLCRQRRSIRYFVPDPVFEFIEENNIYKG